MYVFQRHALRELRPMCSLFLSCADLCYVCGDVNDGEYVSAEECYDEVVDSAENFTTEACVNTMCMVSNCKTTVAHLG